MSSAGGVRLREMTGADVPVMFARQRDPESRRMAAFASKDGDDPTAYAARWERLLREGNVRARMIELGGETVGSVGSWGPPEDRQLTYWVWREHWGRGVATAALRLFLEIETTRPLHASAAGDNTGSRRVLEKCGFVQTRVARAFALGRGAEVDEVFYVLR